MRNAKALMRLFKEFGDLRWYLPLLILSSILVAVFEGLGLYLLLPIFETILSSNEVIDAGAGQSFDFLGNLVDLLPEENRLTALILCVIGLIILKNIFQYGDAIAWTWYDAAANKRVQRKLLDRVLAHGIEDRHRGRGEAINTFENQSWRAVDTLIELCSAVSEIISILFFIGLLVLLSWHMTLLVFIGGFFLIAFVSFMSRHIERLGHEIVETQERVSIKLLDILSGLKTVLVFGNQDQEAERFSKKVSDTVSAGLRQEKVSAAVDPVLETLAVIMIGTLGIFSLGSDFATLPAFVSFIVILRRLMPRVQGLISIRVALAAEIATVYNIVPLLDLPASAQHEKGSEPFGALESDILVKQLTYRYHDDGECALDAISCVIPKGEVTGIAGPSGAGKSTLVDILCRLEVPQDGQILVNGRDLSQYSADDWRRQLGVVTQEIHLFRMSIRDNIAYGTRGATDAEIIDAARAANAHRFIESHSEGYDRVLSDNGSDLSGGQRQRIALARALLRKPSLLILDEATSALDPLAETLVKEAIDARPPGCTVLIVAHRATTLKAAGHIVLMEAGRVVQSGSWSELARSNGLFQRMFIS